MSQRKYALDIFQDIGFTGARLEKFPMEQNLKLSLIEKLNDPSKFRRLIDRLIYLTVTKPDIVYQFVCLVNLCMNQENHIGRQLFEL